MTSINRKVLFFINSEVGGAERMAVLISRIIEASGFVVSFVIIKDSHNKTSIIDFIPENHDVTVISGHNLNYIGKFYKFYKSIKEKKPDIVFSTNYSVNDKLLLLKPLFRRIRFIVRSDFYFSSFNKWEQFVIKHSYPKADLLISQTDEMREEFVNAKLLPASRVVTLENPVDKKGIDEKLQGKESPFVYKDRKNIVAVGRVSFQKGYDILVTAFAELLSMDISAELYIVGSYRGMWEVEYKRVVEIIRQLGIEKLVHFVGYQDNPYQYIKYADCFVLSSRWEGLPNVLAEALYLKTPVAAFRCIPIIERMVRDGIDGCLAEKENPHALAEAMNRAIKLERISPIYEGASCESFVKAFSTVK